MATALKCPNPSCPLLFDPTLLPAGAVLTCPRCGMRFTLGPAASHRPAGASPLDFAADAPTAAYQPPAPAPAEPRKRPTGRPVIRSVERPAWPVVAVVVAVVGLLVGGGVVLVNRRTPRPPASAGVTVFREMNMAYRMPDAPWERDSRVMQEVKANLLGLRRADTDARAAFAASDFKTRAPQPGDLTAGIEGRLRELFENLDPEPEDGATWAGRPAVKVRFRGSGRGTAAVSVGEAYAIAHQGVGYWFIGWAPEAVADAALMTDFADLRSRVRLLDYRADWKPTAAAVQVFHGNEAEYRLSDGDRWWQAPPRRGPADEDRKADLLLEAEYRAGPKTDVRPRATLVTYLLDPAGDNPLAAVKEYVTARYARLFDLTKWTEVTGDPLGDPPAGGEQPGIAAVRFRVEGADPRTAKLVVLAGIVLDGPKKQVVGVEVYCPWSDRAKWEKRLAQLAGSLRSGR